MRLIDYNRIGILIRGLRVLSLFKSMKKTVSMIVVLAMSLSLFSTVWAAQTSVDDLQGHWAEENLRKWVEKDLLKGYDDGSVQPDRKITRAEFITLINRSFQLTEKTEVSFSDLEKSNWAYSQIAIAVKAGYVKGNEDGTIAWNKQVTREQAASMVADLLKLDLNGSEGIEQFTDASSISTWSKPAVAALVKKSILKGFQDGTFAPQGQLTRAQSVTLLENALGYIKPATTYSTAGIYGPETGTETVKGDVIVSAPGVTLRNLVIEGDLTLTADVGQGDVHLNSVNVAGKTTIAGGGENSIHLKDSIFVHIIVNKVDGTIRIVAEGATSVKSVTIQSSVKLEESEVSGVGFTKVELAKELPANSTIKLLGAFEDVNILAKSIRVDVAGGSIASLNVDKGAAEVSIDLNAAAKVIQLVLDTVAKLTGQGKIENAVVSAGAGNSTFEKQPDKSTGEGSKPVTPPSGGSNGNVPTPPAETSDDVYELYTYEKMAQITNKNILPVNVSNQLVNENDGLIIDPNYFMHQQYALVNLFVRKDNNKPYKGNVRIVADVVSATNGGTKDSIQLFAYNDANDSWTNILKEGFGAKEGQSIESLITDLGNSNKWYSKATEGEYKLKFKVVNVSTNVVVAESVIFEYSSENPYLTTLDIGGYELLQLDNQFNVIGKGFKSDVVNYKVIIPNDVEEVKITEIAVSSTMSVGLVVELKEVVPESDGAFSVKLLPGKSIRLFAKASMPTTLITKGYNIVIQRLPDEEKGDPNTFDSTDIRVRADEIIVSNVKQNVTISVYGSPTGDDLLAEATTPIIKDNPDRLINYGFNVGNMPIMGSIWVSVTDPQTGEATARVEKAYNCTPVKVITESAGFTHTLMTEAEMEDYNNNSYYDVVNGGKWIIDFTLLPDDIKDFAYFTITRSSQPSLNITVDDMVEYENTSLISNDPSGKKTYELITDGFYYYTFKFYDKYDKPLAAVVLPSTPIQP